MSIAVPRTITSGIAGNRQFIELEVVAFSEDRARKKAKRYARAKGYDRSTIERIASAGSGSVPGSTKFEVRVTSSR